MKNYVIKDDVLLKVQKDLPLRNKIAAARKGIQGMTVRVACINYRNSGGVNATWLTEPKYIAIIKEHLNLKDSDIFSIKTVK